MKIQCNCCGKELRMQNDFVCEDAVVVEKKWGYFSEKDGEYHKFCLCETCYDEIIKGFAIPVEVTEQTELL